MRGLRLSRLIATIGLLKGPRSYNARRLAEHFHTTLRTIYRDMAVLELSGVPYFYDPDYGDGGGYRIPPNWFFVPPALSTQECIDLAVLVKGAETNAVPLVTGAMDVRDKLLATVGPENQEVIREATALFEVLNLQCPDHSGCRQVMQAFQSALLQKRRVEARYYTPNEKKTVILSLQPRRLFLAAGCWYVAAYEDQAGRTKLFRIQRFKQAKVTNKPQTVRGPFSLREFLGNAWTVYRGRDTHIEIRFAPEVAELVSEVRWHPTQTLLPQKDGSLIFRATVAGLEEITGWILGWGPRAVVLRPKELAERVRDLAARTVANYVREGRPDGRQP